MQNKIEIYKDTNSQIKLEVKLDGNTIWLSAQQIADLFYVNRPAIVKHIQNIYKTAELRKDLTCSILEQVAIDGKRRKMNFYNLDMIISVGYRVNSKRATEFRIWATNTLRKYLVQGYALNEKVLSEHSKKYKDLQKYLKTLGNVVRNEEFNLETSKELMRIISDYSESIELLDKVDKRDLEVPVYKNNAKSKELKYDVVILEISKLREELGAGELFGNEKDNGFKSALKTIFQTFDGKDQYPSIEEKAANLLYMIIKNHGFIDGNKRIGAFMFIRFLDINGLLYRKNNSKLVEPNALVAIALLIAQSDPQDKELMVNLVINLIKADH